MTNPADPPSTSLSIFEDDPVLGKFIANYPVNRLRLILIGGAILAVIWFVLTVALWQVEEGIAATITVAVITVFGLAAGWFIAHLWNREVVIYREGFTYRRGSQIAHIAYSDVYAVRQHGERLSYFGGLVRRSTLRFIVQTVEDEIISLTPLYIRIDDMTLKLEAAITEALEARVKEQIKNGERVPFGDSVSVSQDGLHAGGGNLTWADYGGYTVGQGRLTVAETGGASWHAFDLAAIDNLRLFVTLLKSQDAAPADQEPRL